YYVCALDFSHLGFIFFPSFLAFPAEDGIRDTLNKFTSNPVLGVIAGIVVTIIIQSSSGTTVITIGLVTAGFMTLKQAIGVI
ncbi:Na/Pi symporter, partial [Pseudomonas aeruginosa]|nr:Na/Pi symporter [Pseudomonas aeruginosa]